MTEFNVIRFGSFIRRIDLSFNLLMKLWGLEGCAENLEELILDNNQLTKLDLPKTKFPKLHTISLNKNRVRIFHMSHLSIHFSQRLTLIMSLGYWNSRYGI